MLRKRGTVTGTRQGLSETFKKQYEDENDKDIFEKEITKLSQALNSPKSTLAQDHDW